MDVKLYCSGCNWDNKTLVALIFDVCAVLGSFCQVLRKSEEIPALGSRAGSL